MDLKINDTVYFKLEGDGSSKVPVYSQGKVRYYGAVEGERGVIFGIEITDPKHRGKGSTNGHPYFLCNDRDGIFISMDKIDSPFTIQKDNVKPFSEHYPIDGTLDSNTHRKMYFTESPRKKEGSFNGAANVDKPGTSSSRGAEALSNSSVPTEASQCSFSPGDHVVVFTAREKAVVGSVRWVKPAETLAPMVVAIETNTVVTPVKEFPVQQDMNSMAEEKLLQEEKRKNKELSEQIAQQQTQIADLLSISQNLQLKATLFEEQIDTLKNEKEILLKERSELNVSLLEEQMKYSQEKRDHEKTKANIDILLNEKGELTTQLHDLSSKMKGLVADSNNYRQLLQNEREEHEKTRRDKVQLEDIVNGFEQGWNVSHEDISLTEQELGRGGWGIINVGKLRVAVKQLYKVIMSEKNLSLMQREINIMSKLRHPNLLLFIGAVLDHPSKNPLIITEIMDTSLRQAYEQGQLTDKSTKMSVLRDTAAGLNYLHCHPDEIIHRDVSSANVLLESRGPNKWRAKLSDFGSANIACKAFTRATGATVYCAPEASGSVVDSLINKPLTTKMDVFSYGVLVCEVMTCSFPEMHEFKIMLKSLSDSDLIIGRLVQNCINKQPEDRPTMKLVIQQLDEQLSELNRT